ncbi:family 31 glycoside hydrolase [Plasmopara halstedii]|uniref:alpha-glucosidase n=1 Tax=Plasmopara halstedii TaxID=4781 RepID=A0A0P1AT84_PLAHL|nr:family 31 glycoside hydrolase [Plasmopara halstedii]CEG45520.1 family 31 glycoside hydrolase [Plasmopara halstedii]|eukprot:XP_024581889.1 family 31 glycoside hydrolase [Plasmopara halstedii]
MISRGSTGVHILFQTDQWVTPAIHYKNASASWTTLTSAAMFASNRSAYSSDDGWFQYDVPFVTSLEFVFTDGSGVALDNNNNSSYKVLAPGIYSIVTKVSGFKSGDLVGPSDGTSYNILYQPITWTTPYITFNTGKDWTIVPGFAMSPSTYSGKFSAANGWFQYTIPSTSSVDIAFNDGHRAWDSNSTTFYNRQSPGTYAFVNQNTAKPPVQRYVNGQGYSVMSATEVSGILTIRLALNNGSTSTPYGTDLSALVVTVMKTESDSVRVKILDGNTKRWEVPTSLFPAGTLGLNNTAAPPAANPSYTFIYTQNPFTFKVVRKSDGYMLFDSSVIPLVVKDQYLQVATALGSDLSVYGIGESTRDNFKMATGDKQTLWGRDQPSSKVDVNTYGSHPFFLGINSAGQAHGVLLLNSNGMDVTMDSGRLVYQTIGGVLDFTIMVGPTPTNVMSQYTKLIGRPKLMPYWSYGFHQCRWGYGSVDELRKVVNKYKSNLLPLDVIWADIDYMHNFHDFTVNPMNFHQAKMAAFMDEIHASGRKFVPIIDPGIPDDTNDFAYSKGLSMDIFIKDTSGKPYLGQVWPGPTVFPDFFHPKAKSYWGEQLRLMYDNFDFDGLWIDMNELANFCPGTTCVRQSGVTCPNTGSIDAITTCCLSCSGNGNKYDNPPFAINNFDSNDDIFNKGISASALHYGNIREYDAHNLYGIAESIVTNAIQEELANKRSFVLSRSTFPGSGVHVAHWTGDNAATWNDLRWSIPAILKFGLFGIPMVGADICGFLEASNMELCARWTALGSFYPFARNHNNLGAPSQETYMWPEVTKVGQKFIGMRYRLLPYLYTLGFHAHIQGLPIARPLFMEFPKDIATHSINYQFMLGNALLVTPVVNQGAKSVKGYYPAGVWYNILDYSKVFSSGESFKTAVTLYDMPVHIRGGTILAMHQPALTSTATRQTPFDILVALPNNGSATGDLYLDDGETISNPNATIVKFIATAGSFKSKVIKNDYTSAHSSLINKVIILGVNEPPSSVSFGDISAYDATTECLEISLSVVDQSIDSSFTITWK